MFLNISKYICIAFCSIWLTCSAAEQQIIETHTIEEVLPLVDEDTWFIVDLDNTVFQAKQALGHVNWLQVEVKKRVEEGMTQQEAFYSVYPLWKRTQQVTEVIPVEESFLKAIHDFQDRGITVMALTNRQLFIIPETLHLLSSLDLDLLLTAPTKETMTLQAPNQPALYTQGVLFVDDFNKKGPVLRLFLETIQQKPKKIVFIDDKKKNVEDVGHMAAEADIPFIGVAYIAVEEGEQIYSEELAALQLRYFDKILSNEEVLNLMSQESSELPKEPLYKILSKKDWEHSLFQTQLVLGSIDDTFIHLATEAQVSNVIAKFWQDEPNYVIVKLDPKRLVGRLIYEKNPEGTNKYYHLYEGHIPLDAVIEVKNNQ